VVGGQQSAGSSGNDENSGKMPIEENLGMCDLSDGTMTNPHTSDLCHYLEPGFRLLVEESGDSWVQHVLLA